MLVAVSLCTIDGGTRLIGPFAGAFENGSTELTLAFQKEIVEVRRDELSCAVSAV